MLDHKSRKARRRASSLHLSTRTFGWEATPILVQKAIRFYALVGSAEGWEWERINRTQWRWVKYRRSDAEWMDWIARERNYNYERFLKAAEREEAPVLRPMHLIRDYGLRDEPD